MATSSLGSRELWASTGGVRSATWRSRVSTTGKSDAVSLLDDTQIRKLARNEFEAERELILASHARGEPMTSQEVKTLIKKHRKERSSVSHNNKKLLGAEDQEVKDPIVDARKRAANIILSRIDSELDELLDALMVAGLQELVHELRIANASK